MITRNDDEQLCIDLDLWEPRECPASNWHNSQGTNMKEGWWRCDVYSCGFIDTTGDRPPHNIPCPNIHTLEWMSIILITLADRSYEIIFQNNDGFQVRIYTDSYSKEREPDGYGFDKENWCEALINAAIDLKKKEKSKAHMNILMGRY